MVTIQEINENCQSKKILVIGDAMLDVYQFGEVNKISPEAPVPVFFETGEKKCVPGGAANVAANIAAIGISVDLCAILGIDDEAEQLKQLLDLRKVGIQMICETEGRKTTKKLRFIGQNNQQIFRVDSEDIIDIPYEEIESKIYMVLDKIDQYGLFLISDYNKGFLTEKITQEWIKIANKHNIPVLIDVKGKQLQKYYNATLLKPNRKELSDLTGLPTSTLDEVIDASECLCKKTSSKYVLTTLGNEGMILIENDSVAKIVKSVAKEVFDVTGAGDTSIAYLAAELLLGNDILDAMEISNYAAGLQVSKFGTSIIYPDEVINAMQSKEKKQQTKELDFYQKDGLSELKKKQQIGYKIVFTNGCFDILPSGHIFYLSQAKKLGDILVVGVNSDESVKRLKGDMRPINPLEERLVLLSALEFVDYVVVFQEDTPLELIKKIEPNILVKGGDYSIETVVGAKEVLENKGKVEILPFIQGKSTTQVIVNIEKRIARNLNGSTWRK